MGQSPAYSALVLWDIDHTLIENGGVSKETYAKAFELLTGQLPKSPARTDGRTDPEIMLNMLAEHDIIPPNEYADRMFKALEMAMSSNISRLRERGYALPGARDALEALQAIPGVVQSVLSGNIRPNAFAKLSAFGLHGYIDFEVGGYGSDDRVRSKLVGVACERASAKYATQFSIANTALIGDTPRDVQAGRDGGAYVIAVASGSDSMDSLHTAGADTVLSDLRDTNAVVDAVMNRRPA